MTQERIEAAAKVLAAKDRTNLSSWHREEATEVLAAADAVMFSDEAISSAEDEITGYQIGSGYYSLTIGSGDAFEIVCAVVAALKGDA